MTAQGLRISEDGARDRIERGSLSDLYALLDCRSVDLVTLDTPAGVVDVWLDDEGLLTGRPANPTATTLAHHYGAIWADSELRGPVVLLQATEEGETCSLSPEAEAEITRVLDGDPGRPDRPAPAFLEAAAEAVLDGVPLIVVEPPEPGGR